MQPKVSHPLTGAGDPARVLVIGSGPVSEDLVRILGHSRWTVLRARTLASAKSVLEKTGKLVLVCEAELSDGTWKDVLRAGTGAPVPCPVIVAANHADDRLWMEVLNLNGYNVLGRPFDEPEIFRVLSSAWLCHGAKTMSAGRKAWPE